MSRVKRGTIKNKRKSAVLKQAKGYRFGRSTKYRQAKEAVQHAGNNAFRDRRRKKRDFRGLWSIKINAAARANGMSYSQFIGALNKKDIALNRKVLAEMAEFTPETFAKIVEAVK